MVGEGMTGLSWSDDDFSESERTELMQFFTSFGKAETVPENLMDAVTAASGSSPAFIYMMIEALADGVVKYGMPRDKAYTFVSRSPRFRKDGSQKQVNIRVCSKTMSVHRAVQLLRLLLNLKHPVSEAV